MKIERLILQGFKSFGERSVLEFGPGIHGVVGPNGSGKSNLVEALRWVVGARARELRGEEADNLLFHGADGKAPLGFAEVVLELAKGKERLAVERRLERGGESELRFNGRRTTFKQLGEWLVGTGLSRGGYAVVGQGEISQVLQAGPEILLGYLEEAAGLKPVASAARISSERLDAATHELEALTAKLSEQALQLSEKEVQASQARRARELTALALLYKRSLAHAKKRELEQELASLDSKEKELEAEKERLTSGFSQLESLKLEAAADLEAAQSALSEGLRRAEALSGETRLLEQQREHLSFMRERLSREYREQLARIEQLSRVQEPLAPQNPDVSQDQLSLLTERAAALEADLSKQEQEARVLRQAYESYLQAEALYQARLTTYQEAVADLEAIQSQLSTLEPQHASLCLQKLQAEKQDLEIRKALDEVIVQEGTVSARARAARAEADRLEAFLKAGADLAEGPRKVKESGIAGVLGVVADLIEVPAGLELALEIALGSRLNWVLCAGQQAAKDAIAMLKEQGGRATFLPLDQLKPARSVEVQNHPGVVGLARELAKLPRSPQALATLFGDTLVMQDLEAALSYARAHPDHPRLVTREGEVVEPYGAISGGRVQKGGEMLLQRRRFGEVRAETLRLEQEAGALAEKSGQLRQALRALELELVRSREAELSLKLAALRTQLNARANLAEPARPEPVAAPDTLAIESLRIELNAKRGELALARESQLSWLRYREDLTRFHDAQNSVSQARERLQALEGENQQIANQLSEVSRKLKDLEVVRQGLGIEGLEAALSQARARSRELAEQESANLSRTNALLAELESTRLTKARRETTREAIEAELGELPPGEVEEGGSRTLARKLSETEAELSALGPINYLAEQEHQVLSEEVDRLRATALEAEEAARKLEAELRIVESEYQGRLEGVYQNFKTRLAYYAESLLGAQVELEKVSGGLNLVLKPAGKRTVDLGLLSMGERTMGALAFLFALSEVGEGGSGLPLAILDEVDAPLDEANIQRFTRFLKAFSHQTQFILVTHQKRTMEVCDALYGITSEKGLSRVYSIRREEPVALF